MEGQMEQNFTRHFIQKAVQIVVQSRLGEGRQSTNCNPSGRDWFNLAITDLKDVNHQVKLCLDKASQPVSLKKRWRFCIEISLKTNDGESMVLEYWLITNELKQQQQMMTRGSIGTMPRTGSNASLNKHQLASASDRNSPSSPRAVPHAQSSAASANSPSSSPRGLFTEDVYVIYNKMSLLLKSLMTLTRAVPAHKISFKGQSADTYVFCYRVYFIDVPTCDQSSTSPQNPAASSPQEGGQGAEFDTAEVEAEYDMMADPLDELLIPEQDRKFFSPQTSVGCLSTTLYTLTVSCIYRTDMTISRSLKSLMTGGSKTATKGQCGSVSPVPCAQRHDQSNSNVQRPDEASLEIRESLLLRNGCNQPLPLINDHFKEEKPVIGSAINPKRYSPLNSSPSHALEAEAEGNRGMSISRRKHLNYTNDDDLYKEPLDAAFASTTETRTRILEDLPEVPFDSLMDMIKPDIRSCIDLTDKIQDINLNKDEKTKRSPSKSNNSEKETDETIFSPKSDQRSEPIQIPNAKQNAGLELTGASPHYGSSGDSSFVFVESFKPPFAQRSDPDDELNSFFSGPSPSFLKYGSPASLAEISTQLAEWETKMNQIDEFVNSICSTRDEEEEGDETDHALFNLKSSLSGSDGSRGGKKGVDANSINETPGIIGQMSSDSGSIKSAQNPSLGDDPSNSRNGDSETLPNGAGHSSPSTRKLSASDRQSPSNVPVKSPSKSSENQIRIGV